MEFLRRVEGFIGRGGRKEQVLTNQAEKTVEEKYLTSVRLKESTKRQLSNTEGSYFYETVDGGAVIFKDKEREYNKEVAAYKVNRFLAFDFVPTTVIGTVKKEKGSLQLFVPDARTGLEVSKDSVPKEELVKMVIFDFLINNADRQPKNFLVKDHRILAIDNEASFYPSQFLYLDKFYGESFFSAPISEDIRNKIIKFGERDEGKKSLEKSLEELLDNKEKSLFFKRLEYLIEYAQRGYFQTEQEYRRLDKEMQPL